MTIFKRLPFVIFCLAINTSALYAEKNVSSKKQPSNNTNQVLLEKNLISDAAFHPLFMKLNHKNLRSYKLSNLRSTFSKNSALVNDNYNLFSYGKGPRLVFDTKNLKNSSSCPKVQFDKNFQYIKKTDGFSLEIADFQKNDKKSEKVDGFYGDISLNVLPKDKNFPDNKNTEMNVSSKIGYSYKLTDKIKIGTSVEASETVDKNGNDSKEVGGDFHIDW
jgi:hypothetical protein